MKFTESEQERITYAAKLMGISEEEFVKFSVEEKIKKEHLFKPAESIIARNLEIYRLYEETGNIIKISDQYGISDMQTARIARDVRDNKGFYEEVAKNDILMDIIVNSTYETKFFDVMLEEDIRTIEGLIEYLQSDKVKHSINSVAFESIFRYIRIFYPDLLKK